MTDKTGPEPVEHRYAECTCCVVSGDGCSFVQRLVAGADHLTKLPRVAVSRVHMSTRAIVVYLQTAFLFLSIP